MIKKIIFILTLITFLEGVSQYNSALLSKNFDKLPEEKIHLHFNNNLLLTGETLYYKVYCLLTENSFSKYSKVAYVELINSKNKKVIKHKINLINGTGYGDFFIDTKLESGSYKLVSYTQWMKNKQSFFEKNITIINPFSKKIKSNNDSITPINQSKLTVNLPKKSNYILSSPIKKRYTTREKVSLSVFNDSTKYHGTYSISVKKKNNTNLNLEVTASNSDFSTNIKKEKIYLPELRGSLIQGKVTSKSLKNTSDIKLALSIKNSNFLTQTATTNDAGEFYFNIPNLTKDKVYIQILDKQETDFEITLIENNGLEKEFNNFQKFTLNKNLIEIIKNRSTYLQVENAYYTVKEDSIINSPLKNMLLNQKVRVYKLDDYKRFKSMKETFIEIIDVARIFNRQGKSKIKVIDEKASQTLSYLPSLLIVDGHILYDHTPFIDFDTRNINTISIIKNKYFYGNAIYQGVVLIETFKKDYFPTSKDIKEFNVMQIQPQKKYFFQKHDQINKRIPDFRTQLYWNPNLNTTKKEITFYTSDVTGDFEIDIHGFSKKGELIKITKTFSVK